MTTLSKLFRDYRSSVLIHRRSGEATARSLALLLKPLGGMPARAVSHDHIARRLDEIAETAPVHAKRILSYASSFFDWAMMEGEIVENPTWGIAPHVPDQVRGRQLTLDEVLMIWRAADVLGERLAHAVRLLILTAAPRQQVASLQLSELERDPARNALVWRPTALRLLRGEAPAIILPPMACEIVQAAVLSRRPEGEFILSRTGKTPLDGWSKAKRALDEELARLQRRGQFAAWWLNDLRTSFPALATTCAGVDPMVAEARLGRMCRFPSVDAKMWAQTDLMAEQASEALAAWDALLANKLRIAKRRS